MEAKYEMKMWLLLGILAVGPVRQPIRQPPINLVAACSGGYVALTYDDGPVPATALVLDALKVAQLRATFFVIGTNVAANPDIARRIVAEGHTIANHTWSHPSLLTLNAAGLTQELQTTSDVIYSTTGIRPVYYRPPYGETSPLVQQVAGSLGLQEVLWTADTHDWDNATVPAIMDAVIMANAGGVVIMHDRMPNTLTAVPLIATYYQSFWRLHPVCAGRLESTTQVMPMLTWDKLYQYFFVRATAW